LRRRAVARGGRFTWGATARRARAALADLPTRWASAVRRDAGHGRRPRIAFFSPFPPRKSGVSDYSALLLQELKQTYTIDLYHDQTDEIAHVLDDVPWDREVIARECSTRGWYLNGGVLAAARRVVVHSPWCVARARDAAPALAGRVDLVPHGIWPRDASPAER